MRARFNKNTMDELKEFERYLESKEELQEYLKTNINTEKKLYIEIGMGKGDFITNMAMNDPNNIYIGVEVSAPIMGLAIKKLKRFEEANNIVVNNLILMSFDAANISEVLGDYKVDKIFLNFSDPWPKKKHAKRRLTSEDFLKEYIKISKKDSLIEFKTDNRGLFEYSLVSMQNFGFKFLEVYLDLHKVDIPNVVTEYEEKFSKLGPIYKLVVK